MNEQVLRVHPQLLELYQILEQNSCARQQEEIQLLVKCLDETERVLASMCKEIQSLHTQVDNLENRGFQAKCRQAVNAVEQKVQQAGNLLVSVKEKLVSSAGRIAETFRQRGRAALIQAVNALRIPSTFSRLGQFFSKAAEGMKREAASLEQQPADLSEPDRKILSKVQKELENCGNSLDAAAQDMERHSIEKLSVRVQLAQSKGNVQRHPVPSAKEQAR